MSLSQLMEAVPAPSTEVATVLKLLVDSMGMDSLELLSQISGEDWVILINENKEIVNTAILAAQAQAEIEQEGNPASSSGSSSEGAQTQGEGSPSSNDQLPATRVVGSNSNPLPALEDLSKRSIPKGTVTKIKCYGLAISAEARRWCSLSDQASARKEKGTDERSNPTDDEFFAQLVEQLTKTCGTVPHELLPPVRVVKLLRKCSSTFVDFKIFNDAAVEGPRKRIRTTVGGEQVLCYDDEADTIQSNGNPSGNKFVKLGQWMAYFPRYITALALVDQRCRNNFLAMLRYQQAVGRLAAQSDWKFAASADQQYRHSLASLMALGTPLWECFGVEKNYDAFFMRVASEAVLASLPDRGKRESTGGSNNRKKTEGGGKGRGKGKGQHNSAAHRGVNDKVNSPSTRQESQNSK